MVDYFMDFEELYKLEITFENYFYENEIMFD